MKILITIIAIVLVGWGGYSLLNNSPEATEIPAENQIQDTVPPSPSVPTQTPVQTPAAKEFTVVGKNFSFSPNTIRVNRGEKVRIVFQSQGTHDWVIDEFNARTKVLSSGGSETVEFVVDRAGSFEYYCSVGEHRKMGMKGTLIVE